MYVLSNGEILNWANTIDELTYKILHLEKQLRSEATLRNKLVHGVGTEQSSTTEPGSFPEGLEEEMQKMYHPDDLRDMKQHSAVMKTAMQDWDRKSKTAAPPVGWEEDLLEFYPPEELQDWKQGFAVLKCTMLELDAQVQMLQKEIMVMGMTPQKRPQDELSIEDED